MEKATRKNVTEYGSAQLGCKVDAPFGEHSEYEVLRHPLNNKWAAALLCVPACKVGGEDQAEIDIMNVKLDPLMVSSLRTQPGYAPAWHMSKEHWLTVRLDGMVPFEQACALLDMSFALVGPKRALKKAAGR